MQKKNKKFARIASACTAALLTMAPVITPTATAFADDAQNNTSASSDVTKKTSTNTTESDSNTSSSNSDDQSKPSGKNDTLSATNDSEKKASTVAGLMAIPSKDSLKLTDNNGLTINHINNNITVYDNEDDAKSAAQNNDTDNALKSNAKLKADHDYYRVVQVVLNAPDKTEKYKIDNGIEEKEYTPDDNGNINVTLIQKVHVDQPADDSNKSDDNKTANGSLTSDELMKPYYSHDDEHKNDVDYVLHISKETPYLTAHDGETVKDLTSKRITDMKSNYGYVFDVDHVNIYPTFNSGRPDWQHRLSDKDKLTAGNQYVAEIGVDVHGLHDNKSYGAWGRDNATYTDDLYWTSNNTSGHMWGSALVPVRFSSDNGNTSGNTNTDNGNTNNNNGNTSDNTNTNNGNTNASGNDNTNNNPNNGNNSGSANVQDQTPFFVNAQGTIYQNGSLVNAPVTSNMPADSVKNITSIINGMGLKTYVGNSEDNFLDPATEKDVEKQLSDEGIKADKDGKVVIPASGFTYHMTAEKHGQKAALQIFFKGASSVYDAFPILKFNDQNVMQGMNDFNQKPVVLVDLNDKDWEESVLKQFSAQESTDNKTKINLSKQNLIVNDMDVKQPGLYQAALTVTNGDKKQTTLQFFIGVKGSQKDIQDTRLVVKGEKSDKIAYTYTIENNQAKKANEISVGQRILVYPNDTQTVNNVSYTRVVMDGKKRGETNVWIKTEDIGKQMPVDERGTDAKLMHAAYLYDKLGKRVGKAVIGSYSHVSVVNKKVQIGKRNFYKIANSNNYIAAGNIEYTPRTLKKTAYLWHNNGKHYTRHGHNLVVKKGARIKTWGAQFKIKGKAYYRVAYGKYVLKSDFK